MSIYVAAEDIATAWIEALKDVNDTDDGTATNLVLTVCHPDLGTDTEATRAVDAMLGARKRRGVATVANTLFPSALYNAPGWTWAPELPPDEVAELDDAATKLYAVYMDLLPQLRQEHANRGGTYFSRMISWPGKTGTGNNQLQERITFLRGEHASGKGTSNASNISVAGEADTPDADGEDLDLAVAAGLEEYAVTDHRIQGFPCLVHIDISVRQGKLSLLAVYRHWHLITRGYGNLVGLARLQSFLCQQTGYRMGELTVVGGHANVERGTYSGKSGVTRITDTVRGALQPATSTAPSA